MVKEELNKKYANMTDEEKIMFLARTQNYVTEQDTDSADKTLSNISQNSELSDNITQLFDGKCNRTHNANKKCRIENIKIKCILALCDIFDSYEAFESDFNSFIQSKKYNNRPNKLKKFVFNLGLNKNNYITERYSKVIKILTHYGVLKDFTIDNYDNNGQLKKDSLIDAFYNYLRHNEMHIKEIKKVALKLRDLGFDTITLDENEDFSRWGFEYNSKSSNVVFLENMQHEFHVDDKHVYSSPHSNYEIILGISPSGEVEKYRKKIILSNLAFDANSLPDELTRETTINKIIQLEENELLQNDAVRLAVELHKDINNLKISYENVRQTIKIYKKLSDIKRLKKSLKQIARELQFLQKESAKCDKAAVEKSGITEEQLMLLKRKYLNRTII